MMQYFDWVDRLEGLWVTDVQFYVRMCKFKIEHTNTIHICVQIILKDKVKSVRVVQPIYYNENNNYKY